MSKGDHHGPRSDHAVTLMMADGQSKEETTGGPSGETIEDFVSSGGGGGSVSTQLVSPGATTNKIKG